MRFIRFLVISSFLTLASSLLAADAQADGIKLAQQWAFALGASTKAQIEAGATDPKAIRKKATEDTQPQEKKLRAAMKQMGFTPQHIDQGIQDDRKLYLEDVEADIKAFQTKKPKK